MGNKSQQEQVAQRQSMGERFPSFKEAGPAMQAKVKTKVSRPVWIAVTSNVFAVIGLAICVYIAARVVSRIFFGH